MIDTAEPNRIEAAAEALETIDLSVEAEDVQPQATPEPAKKAETDEKPQDGAQESEETEKPVEAEAEGADKPKDKPEEQDKAEDKPEEPPGYKWQEVERKLAQAARIKSQAEAMAQDYRAKLEALEAREKALSDGNEVLRHYAKAKGMTEEQVLQQFTREYVERQEDPRKAAEYAKEVARREAREEIERQQAEERQKQQQESQAALQQHLEGMVQACRDIPHNEQYAKQLPHLASLPEPELEGKVRHALNWAARNAPQASLIEVLSELDKIEGNAYTERQQRISRWKAQPEPVSNPDEGKASPPQPGRQLSNSDSATSPGPRSIEDRFARFEAAAAALPDFGPPGL